MSPSRSRRCPPFFWGGPDLATLFVTTIGAELGRTPTPGQAGELPGSLLAITDLGITGVPEFECRL